VSDQPHHSHFALAAHHDRIEHCVRHCSFGFDSSFALSSFVILSMAFLLPCPQCDRKLVVTTGQAGGQVRCECGTAVDVPTVRGLRALVEVEESTAQPKSWSTRHSVVFLGAVIVVAGLALTAFLHVRADQVRPDENFAQDIRNKQPYETWELWHQFMRHSIAWRPGTGPETEKKIKAYEELKRWEWIALALGGAGVIVIILGFTLVTDRSAGSPKPPPRRPSTSAERR
jgi:hypothetical protein